MKRNLVFNVGPRQPNRRDDVAFVQTLLNEHGQGARRRLQVDGLFGYETASAIEHYQTRTLKMSFPDGVVSVTGPMLRKLLEPAAPRLPPVPLQPSPAPAPGPGAPVAGSSPLDAGGQKVGDLTEAEYQQAATQLGCEAAVLKALTAVECRGSAFDSLGRPVILFERVWFSRLTHHVWDKTNPNVSIPKHPKAKSERRKEYSCTGGQYARLGEAFRLAPSDALQAASWGKFQIMGTNYKQAGFATPEAFVTAMRRSIGDQLMAFVHFVQADRPMLRAFQSKDWAVMARHYNGPDYAAFDYDGQLARAYKGYAGS